MKLISANYTPGTGESIVKVGDKYGTYEGRAKLHPDEKSPSRYAGCYIAEMRAWIKGYKVQLAQQKAMLKAVQSLQHDLSVNCYPNQDVEHRINLAIKDYSENIKSLEDTIKSIRFALKCYIEDRDKFLNKGQK